MNPWIHFFNRPILWGLALVIITVGILNVILLSPPIVTINWEGSKLVSMTLQEFMERPRDNMDKKNDTDKWGFNNLVSYSLAPFGIATNQISNNNRTRTVIFQSSLSLHLIIMLLCFLITIVITRESNSGIYIIGPIIIYSILTIVYMAIIENKADSTLVWIPALGKLIFWLLITGIVARIVMRLAKRFKWIEGALDDSYNTQPIKFTPPSAIVKTVSSAGVTISKSLESIHDSSKQPASATSEPVQTEIGHSAICCPYCGASESELKKGRGRCNCPKCDSQNFAILPTAGNKSDGAQCIKCNAGILRDAKFCWKCGDLLANQHPTEQQSTEVDTERKYCTQCGTKAGSASKFCQGCGAEF